MPREILVDWTTDAGGGRVSVFWFDLASPVATQRARIGAFLANVDTSLTTTTTWSVRTTGREVDDTTGTLTGVWAEPTGHSGLGGAAGEPIPDASQLLFQWATSTIVNGRFLKGRTFIPGLWVNATQNGNVLPATKTVMDGFAATFVAGADGPGVWHRPVQGAGGLFQGATAGVCWTELAVLRRRRS